MAISDRGYNPYLEKARARLRQDPDADLRDIAIEMFDREMEIRGQREFDVLRNLVGRVLFNGDYKAAKVSLARIVTLKPPRQAIDITGANKVLAGLLRMYPRFDTNKLIAEFDNEIRRQEELRRSGFIKEEDKV